MVSGPKSSRTNLERRCVELGLKMTGQRRVIARVLSEADDHPNVEAVHRRANAVDNRISLATVYRTLRKLLERDRARTNVLPISALGLLEMTRQRVEESLQSA
ncbi:MAG: transcriptional repressor, partial [Alphaproteobacteria bacterium]|nr:transcriptional repressor [Alphaproteobacteria bacterium]